MIVCMLLWDAAHVTMCQCWLIQNPIPDKFPVLCIVQLTSKDLLMMYIQPWIYITRFFGSKLVHIVPITPSLLVYKSTCRLLGTYSLLAHCSGKVNNQIKARLKGRFQDSNPWGHSITNMHVNRQTEQNRW